MKITQTFLLFAIALPCAFLAHASLSWLLKSLLWAWSPLAQGEVEAFAYQRAVYRTADRSLRPVLMVVAGAGVAWGGGLVCPAPIAMMLMFSGVLAILAALVMDLQRWERVAVTSSSLWFQRGFGHKVHHLSLHNVAEVIVHEKDERLATLRHWRGNRSIRLCVRMSEKQVVTLPKTDVFSGAEAVEQVANFMRHRLQQIREVEATQAQFAITQKSVAKASVQKAAARSAAQSAPPAASPPAPVPPAITPSLKKRHSVAPVPAGVAVPSLGLERVSAPPEDDDAIRQALRDLRRQKRPHLKKVFA
jgi:hypothetical protein